MKLSILIVNWNTKELVVKCLRSIFRQEPIFEYEVIVVDNNSADGSAEELLDLFGGKPNVKVISAKTNLGFAKGNNLAYQNSSGEYVLLLNPDTEIKHDALQRMVDYMEENSPSPLFSKEGVKGEFQEIGILGPKLINPDGTLQPSVRRFPDIWSSLLIFSYLHHFIRPKKYLMDYFDYSKIFEVDQVMGAALLTRRSIIEKIGFLDEKFWLWYEEVDFCRRVKSAGFKIVYYPEAIIMHYGGESFSKFDIYQRKSTLARSLIYYFEKNGKWWEVLMLRILMPVVVSVAWVLTKFLRDHPREGGDPGSPSPAIGGLDSRPGRE